MNSVKTVLTINRRVGAVNWSAAIDSWRVGVVKWSTAIANWSTANKEHSISSIDRWSMGVVKRSTSISIGVWVWSGVRLLTVGVWVWSRGAHRITVDLSDGWCGSRTIVHAIALLYYI